MWARYNTQAPRGSGSRLAGLILRTPHTARDVLTLASYANQFFTFISFLLDLVCPAGLGAGGEIDIQYYIGKTPPIYAKIMFNNTYSSYSIDGIL